MSARINMTGQRCGRITVTGHAGKKRGCVTWFGVCDCGNNVEIVGTDLRNGKSTSCGCLRRELTSERERARLIGKQFDRGVVFESAGTVTYGLRKSSNALWFLRCDCGEVYTATTNHLRRHITKSCGCLQRESRLMSRMSHGQTRGRQPSSEYRAWINMMQRCYNPRNSDYSNYGGAGVTVDEPWHDPSKFLKDMGPKPEPKYLYSLSRPLDLNNYGPGRGITWGTQAHQLEQKRLKRELLAKKLPTKTLAATATRKRA